MTDYANPPFHCFARGSVNTGLGLPMTHGDSLGLCGTPLERKPGVPTRDGQAFGHRRATTTRKPSIPIHRPFNLS